MGKASVQVNFEFPDLLKAFNDAKDRIERTIASTIQTQTGMRFDSEGAHNGHEHWAPLKSRVGQILSLSGTLRKSIAPPGANGKAGPQGFVRSQGRPANLLVEVGTTVKYASVHNYGETIKHPGTSNGFGMKIKIPAHDIPMPKRNFTDQNHKDQEELTQTLANLINDILGDV